MKRRAFLRRGALAAAGILTRPAWARPKDKSAASDGDILGQCGSQIEKHRKGEGMVAVRNSRGGPVPDVKIAIEQVRHDFLFGCNVFQFGHCANPEKEERYRRQFAALLNYCTVPFYWGQFEETRGQPNYNYTDQVAQWANANAITCKGHPLVWDHPAGSPHWLTDDKARIEELSNARVREIVSRYKDQIRIWDVVNEATHLPDKVNKTKMAEFGLAVGQERYLKQPLRAARAANPNALLLVNDYRTDQAYYELLKKIKDFDKYLFDVIGIQSHMHSGVWPLHKAWDICDWYGKLDRPLHYTETTILSGKKDGSGWSETTSEGEAEQAEKTVNFYRALFAHPSVRAITWWDFSDYNAWQGAPAGWLRKDMSPKPVYEKLLSLIKGEWWTGIQGQTGPRGNYTTRAFYGTYRVTVEPPDGPPLTREVHWARGQPNQFVFRI